jgi:hypothetical protein
MITPSNQRGELPMEIDRREILRGSLRYLALGAITGIGAALLLRKPAMPDGSGGCTLFRSCSGCCLLARCGLPEAVSARNHATTTTTLPASEEKERGRDV